MFEDHTMNYPGRVLNRDTWGAHINSSNYTAFVLTYPDWLNPLQKHEWRNRGLVVWDATSQVVTHLYANYTLKTLETMKETDTWKTERLQSYQYFTEEEYRAAFARHGLEISELRTLTMNDEKWRCRVEIDTPGFRFPDEHVLVLARKVASLCPSAH